MKNKLIDLNNHLFAQLERLSDETLSGQKLADEVSRTEAIVQVSEQLVRTADVSLRAAALAVTHGARFVPTLPLLESKTND